MKKTTTPLKTPSPNKDRSDVAPKVGSENTNVLAQFLSAVTTMTWQLALAVLMPLIGGFELDKAFNTKPALTILGFIIAVVGVAMVVWRQFQAVSALPSATRKAAK